MIELRHVSHHYDERPVLRPLSLTLRERRIGVVGSNGSGKSTFARLLNALLLPAAGQVLVDGLDTRQDPKGVRRKVGFVFQNPDHQIVFPVVEEDLAFGLKNLKLPPAEVEARIGEVLERYDLGEYRQHPSHLLSGGQKQLLAISGVLVMRPEYVVFDEPTTLLDLRNRNRVAAAIRELPQTAIVVTHDLDLLRDFERVLVFEAGELIADAPPAEALRVYRERMTWP
ncbi:energy-coupling factor ABC transporter ATP-binding protein [Deinococcus radiodurans]|jgi:ABC-type cobalt transport system, ATPase component|uniref:Putative ABC transporter ATP-binding protein DR_2469 n=1 Tax=Deinococcus radiodurans (strain ATCC 13939 / DSM 20539 / JCM 16871 / CCUG 27074 / LMG 4051 / NBRC 15346 / NCIMB 9279 / VKM B-1422 / R1) TaxID=243230 RepID=Y2469_DEIRA|nr:ABC transporter ATP-binding protein [Deinococcus radiodurans]Q9RRL9.1 RecName: Full=Putative ABC transporter ATP-binding protein DR_2469 [Deinococcus radiodurans R1 = ATCC 13939 = DSM 20539]AAF12012.1 ABC transporter, ATP-binding protein [Deinococcus radiodurans R1 = ATCC 13939 = DSM 20539]ANC70495.1 cobalt ABC transporter ATP-binding protein [Deinococcus radiodurans R1 = ATCC 13939 = DSM 20539]QEM71839.1 ABC transporter ATP-binding protein [Deinococcus radiodurans]QIP28120.1 ABC transporte